MSNKWNDFSFNPSTEILLTEGQYEFLEPIPLNHATVSHLASATPKKCEDKLNEMLLILKRQMQTGREMAKVQEVMTRKTKKMSFFSPFHMNLVI